MFTTRDVLQSDLEVKELISEIRGVGYTGNRSEVFLLVPLWNASYALQFLHRGTEVRWEAYYLVRERPGNSY